MIKSPILFYLFFFTFSCISATLINDTSDDAISKVQRIYTYMQFLNDYYETYRSLFNQLNEVMDLVRSTEKMDKQPMISQNLLDDIDKLSNKFPEYNKDSSKFSVKDAIEEAMNKKSNSGRKRGLKNVLSTLNKDVTDQVKSILWNELGKSARQTLSMIKSLRKTFHLIKQSKQFRESFALQSTIDESKEYLDKAEEKLKNIHKQLELLLSIKKTHAINSGLSFLDIVFTVIEYATTPQFALTKISKLLFTANTGLQCFNTLGHTFGFF
jgi:hypothetical protein